MSVNPEPNPAVACFTLRELYAMAKGEKAEGLMGECLAADSESHLEVFMNPCRIDDFVILEAKTLLKYSNMSVQEIAYRLNFPNQSFFGSYFKRNTGMSPSQFKTTD